MGSPIPGEFPFHQIPENLRLPLFWAEVDPSQANSNQQNQRSLLIGPMLIDPTKASLVHTAATNAGSSTNSISFATQPSGVQVGDYVFDTTTTAAIPEGTTVTSLGTSIGLSANATGVLSADVIAFVSIVPKLCQSSAVARGFYGAGSILPDMVDRYRQNDLFGELWTIGIPDDLAATAATSTIVIAGTPSANGTLAFYVNGTPVAVPVTTAMTAIQIATAIAAAFNAAGDINSQNPIPFTSANSGTATVTNTSRHKGAVGNDLDIRLNYYGQFAGEVTPPGLTVTITPFASGATNPATVLNAALNALGDYQTFDFIGLPWNDTTSLNNIGTFLNDIAGRWSWIKQIYGHAFTALRGSVSSLVSFGTGRNDQHATIIGFNDSPSPSWMWAAALTGACAVSARDDPGQPLHGMILQGLLAPPLASRFALSDRNVLVWDGISVFDVSPSGQIITQLVITTYQLNTAGVPDNSYLKVETMQLLTAVLRFLRSIVTTQFARKKLAVDGTPIPANSNIVTPSIIRASMIEAYLQMEGFGWVQADFAFNKMVQVQIDPHYPNRVNILWPGILINQLDVVALLAQFRLSPPTALAA